MARRETTDVLAKARKVFQTAQFGLADLEGADPRRRIPGFHNVIVFGRATTFVLQNLRTIDEAAFDTWYSPRQEAMTADPLLRYFNKLRSKLEKEGGDDVGIRSEVRLTWAEFAKIGEVIPNPPPGATQYFLVRSDNGGSGWEVRLPDGSIEMYYTDLPAFWTGRLTVTMAPKNPPAEHLGQPISDPSAVGLSRLYLAYIGSLLDEADSRFK